MTFGDFARNYLNPFFLMWRIGLLGMALGGLMLAFWSDAPLLARGFFLCLACWVGWIGIKPWGAGKGITISQVTDKLHEIGRR